MTISRIGIIGHGFIAKIHEENLLKFPSIKVQAIFSKPDKKDQVPEGTSFYVDYKKMISQEDLDAVLVCTPTHTHADIACHCAENGLTIFLEKPMARNIDECNKILDSVKENDVRLTVGHVLRFWPTYASIYAFLKKKDDRIGDISSFTGKRLGTFPWSPWFADQSKSGGVILDLSIHDIDYAIWLFGKPISVSCDAKKITKHGLDVIGESIVTLKFVNDKIARCEASWAKPESFELHTFGKIQGIKSFIEFDGNQIYQNDYWNIHGKFSSNDGYYNQIEHFTEILSQKNKRFKVSGHDGKEAVRACVGAIRSAESDGKELFLDDLD